ncbi:MAG: hypothetical protein MK135_14220, partial [Polyangiaceae bacterium]|nr:hypothetical protein [Polyangiaceae bacterium]
LGRQAIGFGRATFFTVVDVLAPFGTFQVDQEWKSGVDAFDIEWQAFDQVALGFTAAAESDFSNGAFLGRIQPTFGDIDFLFLGGKRSEDWMAALSTSMALLDAEFHGEFGFFFTDGRGVPQAQIANSTVIKAVVGGSYTFQLLSGLTWLTEYHFNGFGLSDIPDQEAELLESDWQARFLRGDFQSVGQQEIATSLNLTINESFSAYSYGVVSGEDGSGLASVGGTWNYSDNFSLDLNSFIPWGRAPNTDSGSPVLRSEYGASPWTVYASMRFYD